MLLPLRFRGCLKQSPLPLPGPRCLVAELGKHRGPSMTIDRGPLRSLKLAGSSPCRLHGLGKLMRQLLCPLWVCGGLQVPSLQVSGPEGWASPGENPHLHESQEASLWGPTACSVPLPGHLPATSPPLPPPAPAPGQLLCPVPGGQCPPAAAGATPSPGQPPT